jgi:NADH-quinone oxidoreductase subunit E
METLLPKNITNTIDHWIQKFPQGKQRSAIIAALHAVQHHNKGFLTNDLLNQVADYIDVPKMNVYEVATFYSMLQTAISCLPTGLV